jgi:hypothetical protein
MSFREDVKAYDASVTARYWPEDETQRRKRVLSGELRDQIIKGVFAASEGGLGTKDIANVVDDYGTYLLKVYEHSQKAAA